MQRESITDIVQLLQIIHRQNPGHGLFPENYIKFIFRNFTKADECDKIIDETYLNSKNGIQGEISVSDTGNAVIISKRLNRVFEKNEKIFVLSLLLQASKNKIVFSTTSLETISMVNSVFGLGSLYLYNMKNFFLTTRPFVYFDQQSVTISTIEPQLEVKMAGHKYFIEPKMPGFILFKFFSEENYGICKVTDNEEVMLDDHKMIPGNFYPFTNDDKIIFQKKELTSYNKAFHLLNESYVLLPVDIKATARTPEVKFDLLNNSLSISGQSNPEDAIAFYQPLLLWVDNYIASKPAMTELNVKLDFFNTPSSRMILDIFKKMKALNETENALVINWYYLEDDEDLEEAGNSYSYILGLKFNMIPYNKA